MAILVLFFLIPSVALASWWNPFSWFQRMPQTEQEGNPQINEPPNTNNQTDTTDNNTAEENNQPAVQEKIITVDNPELQKRINELESENSELRQQVNSESKQLSEMSVQYNNSVSKYNDLVNYSIPKFGTIVTDMFQQMVDKYNECRSALGLAKLQLSAPTPVYYPPISNNISCRSSTLGGTTYTTCY